MWGSLLCEQAGVWTGPRIALCVGKCTESAQTTPAWFNRSRQREGRATKARVSRSKYTDLLSIRLVLRRLHMLPWFTSIAASIVVLGLTVGGVMLVLGRRFLREFTRPGVTVEPG